MLSPVDCKFLGGMDQPNFSVVLHSSQYLVHFLTCNMYSNTCEINELTA